MSLARGQQWLKTGSSGQSGGRCQRSPRPCCDFYPRQKDKVIVGYGEITAASEITSIIGIGGAVDGELICAAIIPVSPP